MKTMDAWFAEYAVSHQNRTNRIIHKICVPVIFVSLIGLLRMIPVGIFATDQGPIELGYLFMAAALGWYTLLGVKAFVVMLIQLVAANFIVQPLFALNSNSIALAVLLSAFMVAWIGQFIGHKIEGQKPSFFQDLQFLLIGPLWVVLK